MEEQRLLLPREPMSKRYIKWLRSLFTASPGINGGRGFKVERDGGYKYMSEVDPQLLEEIGALPYQAALVVWCKKYPQDLPYTGPFMWLHEAVKL